MAAHAITALRWIAVIQRADPALAQDILDMLAADTRNQQSATDAEMLALILPPLQVAHQLAQAQR